MRNKRLRMWQKSKDALSTVTFDQVSVPDRDTLSTPGLTISMYLQAVAGRVKATLKQQPLGTSWKYTPLSTARTLILGPHDSARTTTVQSAWPQSRRHLTSRTSQGFIWTKMWWPTMYVWTELNGLHGSIGMQGISHWLHWMDSCSSGATQTIESQSWAMQKLRKTKLKSMPCRTRGSSFPVVHACMHCKYCRCSASINKLDMLSFAWRKLGSEGGGCCTLILPWRQQTMYMTNVQFLSLLCTVYCLCSKNITCCDPLSCVYRIRSWLLKGSALWPTVWRPMHARTTAQSCRIDPTTTLSTWAAQTCTMPTTWPCLTWQRLSPTASKYHKQMVWVSS